MNEIYNENENIISKKIYLIIFYFFNIYIII